MQLLQTSVIKNWKSDGLTTFNRPNTATNCGYVVASRNYPDWLADCDKNTHTIN